MEYLSASMQPPNAPWNGGAPPPEPGWGPPPGAYGAPPPGGYGAPGGAPYGGPGAYGPPPPPPRSPNVGIFVALGCVGAVVLLGALGAAVYFTARQPAGPTGSPPVTSPPPSGTTAGDKDLKLELQDFRTWKEPGKDTQHFVGELVNTGDGLIGFPSARIVFYDAAGTALDTGYCSTTVRVLAPEHRVPCTYGIWKPLPWKSYKIELEPRKTYSDAKAAELVVSETTSTPKAGYDPHMVKGKITNKSGFTAKNVWAIASLHGADGKIVAADNGLVAGKDLAPGGSGLFSIRFYQMADAPVTFKVLAVGYSE